MKKIGLSIKFILNVFFCGKNCKSKANLRVFEVNFVMPYNDLRKLRGRQVKNLTDE